MTRWMWRLFQVLVIAAVVSGAIYWVRFSPITVRAHSVERGQIISEVMGTGTLEARVEATISPKISGRIQRLFSDQGQRVSSNELLVQLDDQERQQQVAIAVANVEATRAGILRLKAEGERAVASYTQAKKSHARNRSLAKQKAVSQDELDRSIEALAIATTGLSRAEAAIIEGQKELVAAEKTRQYHQARLDDCNIKAPFDGLVIRRNREVGDVVVPGTAMMRLISTDQLWVSVWVDETEMARIEPQQTARIVFRSEPSHGYSGRVFRIGKETDRETREFVVDVDAMELPENWAIGQRAEAYIEVDRKEDVIRLPTIWIVRRDGQSGVFVVDEDQARWQPIEIGLRNRESVEISSGLQVGERVLTPVDPKTTLRDGRKVTLL